MEKKWRLKWFLVYVNFYVCNPIAATIEITSTTFGHASLYNSIHIFITMAYRDFFYFFFFCKITVDHHNSNIPIMIPNISNKVCKAITIVTTTRIKYLSKIKFVGLVSYLSAIDPIFSWKLNRERIMLHFSYSSVISVLCMLTQKW